MHPDDDVVHDYLWGYSGYTGLRELDTVQPALTGWEPGCGVVRTGAFLRVFELDLGDFA